MSGRVIDFDFVKEGEVLPVEYIALVESNKPTETSAQIQAVYLDSRNMKGQLRVSDDERIVHAPSKDVSEELVEGKANKEIGMTKLDLFNLIEESKSWLPRNEYVEILQSYGLPDLPLSSDAFKRKLMNISGREKALREEFERKAVEYGGRMKGMGKREMKKELGDRKTHQYPAKNADALRKEVLSMSLFPNLYNRKNLLKTM